MVELKIHSGHRKHEKEHEDKAKEDMDLIRQWSEDNHTPLNIDINKISERVTKELKESKFFEAPGAHTAYDLENRAINLIKMGDKSVEGVKKLIEKIKKTEEGARSQHLVNRIGKKAEEEKAKIFQEVVNEYFKGNEASKDMENLIVGYVLLKIAHGYLDLKPEDTDPTNTKWVKENTTPDAIKKAVEQAIGGQTGQAKTETQTTITTMETIAAEEQAAARQAVANHEVKAMSNREEKLKKELEKITDTPEAKEKMNTNLVHFAVEISALLDNDTLTANEKKQLKDLIDDLNKTVEEVAKKHSWKVEYREIDAKQYPDVKKTLDKLLQKEEEISEEAIKTFRENLVVAVANIMNTTREKVMEAITESLEELINRYKEFMKISRKEGQETKKASTESTVNIETIS
jgi:hypothetical protein